MGLTPFSLSHSRRGAKLRRSPGAANFPQPPKAKGTAAVGCRELVGHAFHFKRPNPPRMSIKVPAMNAQTANQ
jgi:hypothetical protein